MRLGHAGGILGLVALLAAAMGFGHLLAAWVGRALGDGLLGAIPAAAAVERLTVEPMTSGSASSTAAGEAEAPPSRSGVKLTASRERSGRPTSVGAARALRISGATVLRLANQGVRPRGIPVASDGRRPAGLRLVGVSGLGVGLRDGDVLTSAEGVSARSASDVVSVVVAARGQGAPAVGGVFWRDGEPWRLVVEQPYPHEPPVER